MAKIIIPNKPKDGDPDDAPTLMTAFSTLQVGAQALNDENFVGLDELGRFGARTIVMDTTSGHQHSASDGREVAGATEDIRGGVRVKVTGTTAQTSGTWSAELNAGDLTTILFGQVYLDTGVVGTAEYIELLPPGTGLIAGDGFSSRNHRNIVNHNVHAYLLIDDDSSPNRAWVYNLGNGADTFVLLVGT